MARKKAFTIAEKAAIIWRLEAGGSMSALPKKDRDKVQSVYENNSTSIKVKAFKIQRSRNIPISRPILQAKAADFVRQLDLERF